MNFETGTVENGLVRHENCLTLFLDQHEESEEVWVEKPVPQWLYKQWKVLDEQVTLDEVVETIAQEEFIGFIGDFWWGMDECSFVFLIHCEPHAFTITKRDIEFLNVTGDYTIKNEDDMYAEEIREVMNNFYAELELQEQ